MKVTLDGSPQGRTAWRTKPYLVPPFGAAEDYTGYPAIPDDGELTKIYEKAFQNDWQILTHANGDAAMDQMIRTLKPLTKKYGNRDRRFVLIHGQYLREDQLDSYKELDIITSLFPLHTFYWGDWHSEIIGEGERLTPYEALQAITIWSAYQHFEDKTKGSLEAGKLADFIILDNNLHYLAKNS